MQIRTDKSRKELKEHGSFEFPVRISYESLSRYPSGNFMLHWHPEIELTLILEGEMEYQVNGCLYYLKEGEGLMGNSNSLHTGWRVNGRECKYLSVTFDPKAVYGYEGSAVQKLYVEPIINCPQMKSMHFTKYDTGSKEILQLLWQLHQWSSSKPQAFEIEMNLLLGRLWLILFQYYKTLPPMGNEEEKNITRLKEIITYIKAHYQERITLEDIGAHVSICKSECCRFFKSHTNTTIFEYLLSYRVEQSLKLLNDTDYGITEISQMSGFTDSCYFTKTFKRYKGCTPREYRAGKNDCIKC